MKKKRIDTTWKQIFARLYPASFRELQQEWDTWLQGKKLQKIFTPNPEQLMLVHDQPEFAVKLLQGDVLVADGTWLVKAAAKAGKKVPRITGADLLEWWLFAGERRPATLLLGGYGEVAAALAKKVNRSGSWCQGVEGYKNIRQPTPHEEKTLLEHIEAKQPAVIFVGFGAPWQENWILDHAEELQRNGTRVAVACGGAIDMLSPASRLRRAPSLWRSLGVEWLYRLAQEPSRWKRQSRVLEFIWKTQIH